MFMKVKLGEGIFVRIIVVGAGEVGFEIAARLSRSNQDVVVIEQDQNLVNKMENALDVLVIQGNGASAKVLEAAGIKQTRLLIAVTGLDELNIMACMLAKRYGVEKTVARVRNPEYGAKNPVLANETLGIDLVINPERVAASEIIKLIKTPAATEVEYFAHGRVQILGFRVDVEAPIAGKKIKDLSLSSLIVAITRNGEVIIPGGNDMILPNDTLFVIGKTGSMSEIGFLVGKSSERIRRVMVVGGSIVGYNLVQMLQKYKALGVTVKLIEQNKERCQQLAEELPDVLVLHGSGTDLELLREEGIEETDAFIAVTGNDEVNILSCLLAKHFRVRKVILEVGKSEYAPMVDTLGIDLAVHPRLITATTILNLIKKQQVLSIAILKEERVQALEVKVPPGLPFLQKKIRDLQWPEGALVGCIWRNGEVIIPRGNDVLLANDHLIIISLPEASERVTNYFTPRS